MNTLFCNLIGNRTTVCRSLLVARVAVCTSCSMLFFAVLRVFAIVASVACRAHTHDNDYDDVADG